MARKTIYELFQVSSNPRKNDYHCSNYKIYNSSLYMEAECNIEMRLGEDIPENISDEEFDRLVKEELENIMETLETYGRYPEYGIPKYVMY